MDENIKKRLFHVRTPVPFEEWPPQTVEMWMTDSEANKFIRLSMLFMAGVEKSGVEVFINDAKEDAIETKTVEAK